MTSPFNLANFLTVIRLLLIPFFAMAVYYQHFQGALTIFFCAAVTDGLDGLVARAFNQKTQIGAMLDPMADKLLLVTAFIVLSMQGFTITPPIPFWVTAAAISRDVFIVLGALIINMTSGFSEFLPSRPGKLNTLVQVCAIVLFLGTNAFALPQSLLLPAYVIVFGMAVFSGIHYIFHVNRLMNQPADTSGKSQP